MVFAATYPEKLHALCLYAPFARVIEAPDYPIGYPRKVVDLMVEVVGQTWESGQVAPTAPSFQGDQRFLEWFGRYQRRSASPSAAKRFLRMAMETDLRAVLPLIRVHRWSSARASTLMSGRAPAQGRSWNLETLRRRRQTVCLLRDGTSRPAHPLVRRTTPERRLRGTCRTVSSAGMESVIDRRYEGAVSSAGTM